MTTIPTAFAVGARLIAGQLNQLVTAVLELQTKNTAARYDVTRTGLTEVNSTYSGYAGTWSSAGGYVGSGIGVTVPNDGIYLATLTVAKSAGTWSGRVYHEIQTAGSPVARFNTVGGVSEDWASVTCVTSALTAGTVIAPAYLQSSGGTCTTTVQFTVVWLGAA